MLGLRPKVCLPSDVLVLLNDSLVSTEVGPIVQPEDTHYLDRMSLTKTLRWNNLCRRVLFSINSLDIFYFL